MNYTYILECKDGTYYTGWTNHLKKRLKDHNDGKGAKYTKSRLPVKLLYYEKFPTKEEAMRREYTIKQMTRNEKNNLMNSWRKKKVIIFDMDGTLIDSVGIWNEVDVELIRQLGDVVLPEEDVQRQRDDKLREFSKKESPYLEYCKYLGKTYGSTFSPEEIHTLRYDIANNFLVNRVDYKTNAAELIKKLKEAGFTLVIATTTRRKNMDIYRTQNKNLCEKANIDEYFSLIYTREDAKEMKPNPEIYRKVMESLQVTPEECLIFEDSLIGVEAAKNAGIDVVAVYDKYSDEDRDEINRLATYCIQEYDEVHI